MNLSAQPLMFRPPMFRMVGLFRRKRELSSIREAREPSPYLTAPPPPMEVVRMRRPSKIPADRPIPWFLASEGPMCPVCGATGGHDSALPHQEAA